MLQSPSISKKNSILKAIIGGGRWAGQITPTKMDDLQMTGDILLLGKFSMETLSKNVDIKEHELYSGGAMLGVFVARMWTEMLDDGLGLFFDEGSLDMIASPIVSQIILDEDGKRIGTVISMDHDSGTLYVAAEMVGGDEELDEFSNERLLWPDIVIRSAKCPKCGKFFTDGGQVCPHIDDGVKPIIKGYAESLTLRMEKAATGDIGDRFLEQEEFLDLQPAPTGASRRISSGIELFRFIVTDDLGPDLLKVGPHTCSSGRELLLSKEEVEDWVDQEDYDDGYIVFLGTINGDTTKTQVEAMIAKGKIATPNGEVHEDDPTGFEFPE